MTIASKLETINEALGDIKSSIVAKGVTPTGNITTFSTAIESISTGDEITATNTTGSSVSADDRVWVEPEINYTQNFSIGGNPAINNFTLTSTDYPNRSGIVYNMINPPVPQESVEVQLKGYINYNTSANYPNANTGYGDFSIYCKAPGSGGYPYESALSLFLGDGLTIQTNKGANTYTILPRTSLVKDQMYWFKVLVTDSQIVASYSTDGSSWINTTLSASGLLAAFTNTYIGMSTATSEGYGTYDLLETYVKVDGNTVWTPYTTSTTYSIINDTDITSTSFTGVAQEAIANNATGAVKTLLDGNGSYAPTTATKTITTNGTYTASAENAYGLSEVTVDVPSAPTKKYNLLDRVKDDSNNEIGTVSGFFTDANNVEYAVVCLDAQYRLASGVWMSSNKTVTDLPLYSTAQWGPWEAKETATYNTQKILDYCAANSYTSSACTHCRSKSFTIDGTTYYGQLPNVIELNDIVRNHTAINTADTTAGSYSSVDFSTGRERWSSCQFMDTRAWSAGGSGGINNASSKSMSYGVIPVLEIPNT